MQVPTPDGGRVVFGGGDGVHSRVAALLLPLNHPPGAGGIYYHYLLVVLIGLCIASTGLGALLPASFPADLASGVLTTLQGLWFYQTAFTLYGSMLPEGCHRDADGNIECHGHAAGERAEQLASFQLFAYIFLVFAYTLGCYAVAAAKYGHPDLWTMRAVEMEHRENRADRVGLVGSSALSREQGVI